MSQRTQQGGIQACRIDLDDQYDGKTVFQFSPLQGAQDGTNLNFQIPQSRIVVTPPGYPTLFPQIYINEIPVAYPTIYGIPNPKAGLVAYTAGNAPKVTDSVKVTFNWTWLDDIELDSILNRASNECGFLTYYTNPPQAGPTTPGAEPVPQGGSVPTDIPDGLYQAIIKLAIAAAAASLARRFSMKYDFSAGDQNYSPSQMAKMYSEIAKDAKAEGLNARDDFYKGQGRQYRPASGQQGYILPNWTPPR